MEDNNAIRIPVIKGGVCDKDKTSVLFAGIIARRWNYR